MRTPKEVYESDVYKRFAQGDSFGLPNTWFADVYQALGQALERSAALEEELAELRAFSFCGCPLRSPNAKSKEEKTK